MQVPPKIKVMLPEKCGIVHNHPSHDTDMCGKHSDWLGLGVRVSTLPKKVQISVQNSVQAQNKFVQYSSGTVKLTISKKQFFYLILFWSKYGPQFFLNLETYL